MQPVITRRDLRPPDLLVLCDLVRFGLLALNQIERRFGDASQAVDRLAALYAGGLTYQPNDEAIDGITIYCATQRGARIARSGARWSQPRERQLAHDVAVVDLADYLVARTPEAEFRTEREVSRTLRELGPSMRGLGMPGEDRHTPDGLLLSGGKWLAIELEHSDKGEQRYRKICRWFASEVRLDGIRWYVDNPRTIDRIRKVNREHGFDRDIDVTIEPFPPGVFVRNQKSIWRP